LGSLAHDLAVLAVARQSIAPTVPGEVLAAHPTAQPHVADGLAG
jgi:hypothetical protein